MEASLLLRNVATNHTGNESFSSELRSAILWILKIVSSFSTNRVIQQTDMILIIVILGYVWDWHDILCHLLFEEYHIVDGLFSALYCVFIPSELEQMQYDENLLNDCSRNEWSDHSFVELFQWRGVNVLRWNIFREAYDK